MDKRIRSSKLRHAILSKQTEDTQTQPQYPLKVHIQRNHKPEMISPLSKKRRPLKLPLQVWGPFELQSEILPQKNGAEGGKEDRRPRDMSQWIKCSSCKDELRNSYIVPYISPIPYIKKSAVRTHACNPRSGEAETGASQGLVASQSSQSVGPG